MRRESDCTGKLFTLPVFILIVISMLLFASRARAQFLPASLDDDASGKYFFVAFPDTAWNALDVRFPNTTVAPQFSIWIYSAVKNKVTITAGGGTLDRTVLTLEPGKFKIYDVKPNPLILYPNIATRKTLKVESDEPIVIYCYEATIEGLEAWTPIPVDAWGTEYFGACIPAEVVREIGVAGETLIPTTKKPAPSEFTIIAAYDNTRVTLRPPPGTGFLGNPPNDFMLNSGEAFMVQSRVDTTDGVGQMDLAGTVIQSDRPIGVISGNTRAQAQNDEAGLEDNAYKNMLMEWLAPNDLHGTEFVFMPTWDGHRPGSNGQLERKREYVRMYSTQGAETRGYYLAPAGSTSGAVAFKIPKDTIREFPLGSPVAIDFKTETPAQALMHSTAVVYFAGSTPCYRGLPCLDYQALAPYMVELIPREQWTTFAPYYAPYNPPGMAHYINVVTDTLSAYKILREDGSKFLFNRRIPGTDLVWGSTTVQPGVDHYLAGQDSAKFTGFVYGIMTGRESYRPGRTFKKDPNPAIAGGGSHAPEPLHPAEYEEFNALSYGYPIAPKRRVLRPGDSLDIDTVMLCSQLSIKARALDINPVGLRSVSLEPGSVNNAKLVPVDPQRLADIIHATHVEVLVAPIDPTKSAQATVVIKDRTGKIWRIYYKYTADRIDIDALPLLDFKMVTLNNTEERTLTITNPLDRPVDINAIKLAFGTAISTFRIVSVTPGGPESDPPTTVTLPPHGTMTVKISVTPVLDNQLYTDTLYVQLPCARFALPLVAATARPYIYVGDLNFGTFVLDKNGKADPKTLPLVICNIGAGYLTFDNPATTDATRLLEWLDKNFNVAPADIAELKGRRLGPNECDTVDVTFTPPGTGFYQTTGRFWGSTRDKRDTSVWTAIVVKPGPGLTGYDWGARWLTVAAGVNCTKDSAARYEAIIDVTNSGNSPVRVRAIELVGKDFTDGYFRFGDPSDRASTILPGDEIPPGEKRPQKVIFTPTGERTYLAQVRLITEAGDTLYSVVSGTGIESHGSISGATYAPMVFAGAYPATVASRTVTLKALPTRPLSVTDILIGGKDAAEFGVNKPALGLPWLLQPGESRTFAVEFRPLKPGDRTAIIEFVGDHSFCDDSANTLTASSYVRGVATTGFDAGPVLTCESADGTVLISNTGSDTVTVNDVKLDEKSGYISLSLDHLPYILAPGETWRIPVHFEPLKVGTYSGTVTFDVAGNDGKPLAAAAVTVAGSGYILTVHAHINSDYRALPGGTVVTPVTLDEPLDGAKITQFFLGVLYNKDMMSLANSSLDPADVAKMLEGTIVAGWDLQIVEADHAEGEYLVVLTAPSGKFLQGTGNLLNPNFRLYLGSVDSSKLSFYMLLTGKQCARVVPTPGLARIDSLCGLNLRLIESTGFGYTLDQNKPNPFNPTTDLTFSLGLDGPTVLTVYDALGRRVATLVDGYLPSGTYQVAWDATAQPSGLYYYRLQSGVWTRTATMTLRK